MDLKRPMSLMDFGMGDFGLGDFGLGDLFLGDLDLGLGDSPPPPPTPGLLSANLGDLGETWSLSPNTSVFSLWSETSTRPVNYDSDHVRKNSDANE